jgi:hypothetical protein
MIERSRHADVQDRVDRRASMDAGARRVGWIRTNRVDNG